MNSFWQDLRHAPRTLFRQPLIALIAMLTLSLAIGANTAIYTVLDATLLSPPPYAKPEQLYIIWGVMPNREIDTWAASSVQVDRYQREAKQFQDIAGYIGGGGNVLVADGGQPQQVQSLFLTWNLLDLLGTKPFIGRGFTAEDGQFNKSEVPPGAVPPADTFNAARTVLIGYDLWQTRFGGDPKVIGKPVEIDNFPATIVGVMPRDFQVLLPQGGQARPDLLQPLRVDLANAPKHNVFLNVIGRVRDGVTRQQAQAEMEAISSRMAAEDQILSSNKWHNRVSPLRDEMTQGIRPVMFVLSAAVGLVLLIACANVTNLLLVRAAGQARDTAIRTALGGSRRRLVQRSLVETGLLVLISTVLGLALAWVCLPLLIAMQPQNIPQLQGIGIDGTVLAFTVLVTAAVTLLAGLAPALSLSRLNLVDNLRERSAVFEGRSARRWRSVLIVGEVAVAFTLLVGAGLLLRSFAELTKRDPGFDPNGVLTFLFNAPVQRYPTPADQEAFRREFYRRVSNLPGVVSASAISNIPLGGPALASRWATNLTTFNDGTARQSQYRATYPGYFATIRGTLLSGREFTWADEDSMAEVVIVDDALAARAWPGESPIGKTIYIRKGVPEPQALQVIGVVRHQAVAALDEEPGEVLYFTQAMSNHIGFGGGGFWVVRSGSDPTALTAQIQAQLHEMDPEIPLTNVNTMIDVVQASAAPMRFAMTLIGLFAGLAFVLAVVGLYGLLAFRVRQRQPELGLRLTLGAKRSQVFGLVVSQGLWLVGIGLVIGIAIALAASRSLGTLLVDVTPTDPVTYVGITVLFLAVALIACTLPAWRATRVDPAVVLREE